MDIYEFSGTPEFAKVHFVVQEKGGGLPMQSLYKVAGVQQAVLFLTADFDVTLPPATALEDE